MELAGETKTLKGAAVPTHCDHPAAETDGPNRLVQGGRRSRNLDHDVGSAVLCQRSDSLGHTLARVDDGVGPHSGGKLPTRVDSIDTNHKTGARPVHELRHEQANHAESRYNNDVAQGWPRIEYAIQGGVQVGVQHAQSGIHPIRQLDRAPRGRHDHALVWRVAEDDIADRRRGHGVSGLNHPTHVRITIRQRVRPIWTIGVREEPRGRIKLQLPLGSAAAIDVHLRAGAYARKHRGNLNLSGAWSENPHLTHLYIARPG